ncbi:MAG: HAD family hydrolase, partial [Planctomycetota bacterium]
CPHHPQGVVAGYDREHPWRKPSPGMLLQAARDLDLNLSRSWMVGDALRDCQAGRRAGCRTLLLVQDPAARPRDSSVDAVAEDLLHAAALILRAADRPDLSPQP